MIIDGKKVAADLRAELKKKVAELKSTYNAIPGLTVILVGEDPPSKIYVRNKEKSAIEVGINSEVIRYQENVEEKVLLNKILQLPFEFRSFIACLINTSWIELPNKAAGTFMVLNASAKWPLASRPNLDPKTHKGICTKKVLMASAGNV